MKATQNFEVRVISLLKQEKRREKMALVLDGQLDWKFTDAIAGSEISWNHNIYDQNRRIKIFGYDMKINEIACFLSHRLVWEECVLSNKYFLVLEDDIQFVKGLGGHDVKTIINELIKTQGFNLFSRLGNSEIRSEKVKFFDIDHRFSLSRYKKDPLGAFAYVISPKVASNLLQNSKKIFTPVDDFMWRGWEHESEIYDVLPKIFFTEEEGNPSSIGDRKKPEINFLRKISREWFRYFDVKKKKMYEGTVFKKASGGRV